ncbi:MAG: YicC/YloC family endoribonuclease, partial [Giesbergeria sp.]
MAVYSMTGYASAQTSAPATSAEGEPRSAPQRRLGMEIRSVNSRFLDLSFRLPDELRSFEPLLRSLVTTKVKRGKIEVRAAMEGQDANALTDPPPRVLQRLSSMQDTVQSWLPDAAPL